MRKLLLLLILSFFIVGCGVSDGPIIITETPVAETATPVVTITPTAQPTPTQEVADICDLVPERHKCNLNEAINPGFRIQSFFDSRALAWRFPGSEVVTYTRVQRWHETVDLSFDRWFGWTGSSWSSAFIPQIDVSPSGIVAGDEGYAEFNVSSARGEIGWEWTTGFTRLQADTGYLIKFVYVFEADCRDCPFATGTSYVSEYCRLHADNGQRYDFPDQSVSEAQVSGDIEEAAFFLYVDTPSGIGGEIHCGWKVSQGRLSGPLLLLSFEVMPVDWDPDDAQVTIGIE